MATGLGRSRDLAHPVDWAKNFKVWIRLGQDVGANPAGDAVMEVLVPHHRAAQEQTRCCCRRRARRHSARDARPLRVGSLSRSLVPGGEARRLSAGSRRHTRRPTYATQPTSAAADERHDRRWDVCTARYPEPWARRSLGSLPPSAGGQGPPWFKARGHWGTPERRRKVWRTGRPGLHAVAVRWVAWCPLPCGGLLHAR